MQCDRVLSTIAILGVVSFHPVQERPPLPRDTLPAEWTGEQVKVGIPAEIVAANQKARPYLELGRALFFDPVLSIDRSVSCASCHQPAHGFASPQPFPLGVHGNRCARNSPTLLNRALGSLQTWDGRAATLEQQVLMPIVHPDEMGLPLGDALARLAADGSYARRFEALGGLTEQNLAAALAAFVRGLVVADTPIDRFRNLDDRAAMQNAPLAGFWIYESKGRCWRCHVGPNFSDERFHNTGVGTVDGFAEPGRFAVTADDSDRGRFKTPTLRGLKFTAPYMHDGSIPTLKEVVEFYRRGGHPNAHLDPELQPLDLSDSDVDFLVAFLEALSEGNAPRLCRGKDSEK